MLDVAALLVRVELLHSFYFVNYALPQKWMVRPLQGSLLLDDAVHLLLYIEPLLKLDLRVLRAQDFLLAFEVVEPRLLLIVKAE